MTRQYITLPNPTTDSIRNAATKNPPGTWVMYGAVEVDADMSKWEFKVPKNDIMASVRHWADKGLISMHRARADDGLTRYVFKVLG